MKHLKYLWYVLKHKFYVFKECSKRGHIWLGLTHDLSKFRWSEWNPYVEHFYGSHKDDHDKGITDDAFEAAWLYHQNRNRHHWQYFLSVDRKGGLSVAEMPEKYIVEMICDWIGAAKAKGQGGVYVPIWFERYEHSIVITDKVKARVEELVYNPK